MIIGLILHGRPTVMRRLLIRSKRRVLIVHLPLLYLQCVNPEMFFTARFFNGNVMCMV